MNNDLISRSALIDVTQELCDAFEINWTDKKVLAWVETAPIPAVDAVEVVRCKYCKHRKDGLYCRLHKEPVIVTNVDFCSYGERREDG